jgi:hypothetical protein
MLYGNNTNFPLLLLYLAVLIIVIGHRPLVGGDMTAYKNWFMQFKLNGRGYDTDDTEWFFYYINFVCAKVMYFEGFSTVIACGYFGFMLLACIKMFKKNTWGGMLFLLGSFSAYSYATNGIRNGLACSMILFALSFALQQNKRSYIIAGIIAFFAVGVHKTTALPVVCFAAAYFIRSTKVAMWFWIISIGLNIVAHGAVESFFSTLGLDDRLSSYIQSSADYATFAKSGFRLDFLIYGAMPIWLAYYILIKRRIKNRTFSLLANTYIYANSFWVMMMQAAYSNRFAYLSWFMLPIVLAYPCLRMNVWEDRQGQVAGKIMLAHSTFTFFMTFIYY